LDTSIEQAADAQTEPDATAATHSSLQFRTAQPASSSAVPLSNKFNLLIDEDVDNTTSKDVAPQDNPLAEENQIATSHVEVEIIDHAALVLFEGKEQMNNLPIDTISEKDFFIGL